MIGKLRALDYTYHDKNLYAMNNVRAAASDIGRQREISG